MIEAKFTKTQGVMSGFSVEGHAEYDEAGKDIVCASVTSAVQMAANGITEVLREDAKLVVEENKLRFWLSRKAGKTARCFLDALYLHLNLLSEDYPDNILVTILEVHDNA